eukprot:TRINITY_DN5112_c0_g3_i1.p1 TRINITY_DN5112_c0_g3~~TRINITY_DN5112_c0_g3_i1.p1  ORF type:complete len:404 (+),score=69.21 TRINITY_DN5112_c0_g3_i1:35-1213(+)
MNGKQLNNQEIKPEDQVFEEDDLIEEEEEEWDEWEEQEEDQTKSLFDDTVLPSVEDCLQYDQQAYSFNIATFCAKNNLDDVGRIKLINFIRSEVSKGGNPLSQIISHSSSKQVPWDKQEFLMPHSENDPLLWFDFEDYLREQNIGVQGESTQQLKRQIEELQSEVDAIRAANEILKQQIPVPEEDNEKLNGIKQQQNGVKEPTKEDLKITSTMKIDQMYFDSYSYFGIHRDMLEDQVRTLAYREAISQCSEIENGTVLDVGCGTGILSLFCKREGKAKRVIGVDASEEIARFARQIFEVNGYRDRKQGEIVVGKIEEAKLPLEEGEKVDVIVSEWMGFALLFETMLNSVLWARDRYLKPGGVMLPCSARIFVAGGSESALGLDFWEDVYGQR